MNPPDPAPDPPRRRRSVLVWLERLVTAGLLVFVLVRLGPQLGALTGVGAGQDEAPPFTLATLDGDTVRLADLRGRVVVVNFWATWCGPCRLEMPALQALSERHDTSAVRVLGVSVDQGPVDGVRSFLDERGITYPVGMATWDHRRAVGGVRGIPTTLVIGPDGVVRHRVVGYFAPPAMNAAVGRLLE